MKQVHQIVRSLENENGFALISIILILALLISIGIAGTNTAIFELRISGNERQAYKRFYAADSGWKQAGPFLNAKAVPPGYVNLTLKGLDKKYDWTNEYYKIVRNFGDGADGLLNDGFPLDSRDGVITNIPYWYKVIYRSDDQAVKFGADYRDFEYQVICSAQGKAEVVTSVKKVFRVGY